MDHDEPNQEIDLDPSARGAPLSFEAASEQIESLLSDLRMVRFATCNFLDEPCFPNDEKEKALRQFEEMRLKTLQVTADLLDRYEPSIDRRKAPH